MRLRLSTRLILGVVLIEAVMLSVLVWNSVRLISSSHAELLEDSTKAETVLIANNLAPGLLANDVAMINDSLSLLEGHRNLTHLDVHDRSGKIIASLNTKSNSHTHTEIHRDLLQRVSRTTNVAQDATYEDALSDGIFDIVEDIELYGQHLGTLHAGYSIEAVRQLTKDTRLQNTSIAAVELILSIFVTILLGLFLTKGLRKLEEGAQLFGSGDLDYRINIKSNDEIGDVASSFNQMANHISKGQTALEDARDNLETRVKERTKELEKASKAKSEFLSRMSHELRTPLNAILGFGQILDMETAEGGDNKEYIGEIIHAGNHLLELINEVLDISSIEAGKLELHIESFSINDLLQECISLVKPLIDERKITYIQETQNSTDYYITADMIRTKQVMLNLLSNAIKFNKPGGKIILEFNAIDNSYLRISVTDTGIGIPEDTQDRLFKPFERIKTSEVVEGTGIGLALTKNLVGLMNGRIGFTSQSNRGSTFWVEFKRSEIPQVTLQKNKIYTNKIVNKNKESCSSYKVLCVEDNPANLRLIKQILSTRTDIELLTSHNGELGIDLAIAHSPDLVLLDIGLPGISGYEVIKHLKNSEITANIPVLAISANAMPKDIEKATQAGFAGYLTKPINVTEFYHAVEEHVPKVESSTTDTNSDTLTGKL